MQEFTAEVAENAEEKERLDGITDRAAYGGWSMASRNEHLCGLRPSGGLRGEMLWRAERAFTIVELLTVVAIMAILAGILTSVVLSARGRAAVNQAKFTVDQMGLALKNMKDYYRLDGVLGVDENGDLLDAGTIQIGRELDPFNEALGWLPGSNPPEWDGDPTDWEPHMNMRYNPETMTWLCKRFFEAKRSYISSYRVRDPWGELYEYEITVRHQDMNGDGLNDDIYVERVLCKGPDSTKSTEDDIYTDVDRRVVFTVAVVPPPP